MREKYRLSLALAIVILFITLQGCSVFCEQNFILRNSAAIYEPILIDNQDGNWTVVWSLDNRDNYTLQNVELSDSEATLLALEFNFEDDTASEFNKGVLKNVKLNNENGLVINLSGAILTLIADSNNNRVLKTNFNEWCWQYGSNTSSGYGLNYLKNPSFAVPLEGNRTLITDSGNNRVVEVGRFGEFYWQYGSNTSSGAGENLLSNPESAVKMSNGNILIADTGNNYVVAVNSAKKIVWKYDINLTTPTYAEELANGSILITDQGNHRVIEVNTNKQIYWQYGNGKSGFQFNQLTSPNHATRLNNGNTLISDSGNERVIEVGNTNNIVWQYGKNRVTGYIKDRLSNPTCAVRLENGNTLITDSGNHRVMEVDIQKEWIWQYGNNNTSGNSENYLNFPISAYQLIKKEINGQYYSQVFDGGEVTNWTTIRWQQDLPPNTQILISTRTGTSPNPGLSGWSAWSEDYLKPSSNIITSPKNRYIQYRVLMVTQDRNVTPVLKAVEIAGNRFEQSGELSTELFEPSGVLEWVSINHDSELNSQSITTYYSTSTASSWNKVRNDGDLTSVPINTGAIRFKFVLSTSNTCISPILNEFSLIFKRLEKLDNIKIEPASIELLAGEKLEFIAKGYDKYGREVSIDPVWETNVGVMVDNVFTAQTFAGSGTVTARVADITSTAEVSVKLNPKIHHPPRILSRVPDQVKPEDSKPWALKLSGYEWDLEDNNEQLRWYLTDYNESLYSVTGSFSESDVLNFLPNANAYGNDKTTLWLVDSDNQTASQTLWVNLTPVNDKPTFAEVPDISVHYDDEYTFDYSDYIRDIDTPLADLSLVVHEPTGQHFTTVDGLNVTYSYPNSMFGEIIFAKLIVSDGVSSAQVSFIISVTDNFAPLLIKPLPAVVMFEGETKDNVFYLNQYFKDPDNDKLSYLFNAQYLTVTIHENSSVTISSPSKWSGTEKIVFRALDQFGSMAEGHVRIIIIEVNDPPIIKGVPDFYVRYDHEYKFNLTRYISDIDNNTNELIIIPSDINHIRTDINNNMLIVINYPIEYLGQCLCVRFVVFDGLNYSSQEVNITISDNYPPELLRPLPEIVFFEDETLTNAFEINNYFKDHDHNTLIYTVTNRNTTILINPNGTIDFTAPRDWYGTEYMYFRATDPDGALQESLLRVTVLPVNDPPVISPIPDQFGNESDRWMFDLKPFISDVDNDLSELVIDVDCKFVVVSGNTLIFFGSRNLPEQIDIHVSDGEFDVSQTINTHIKLAESKNERTVQEFVEKTILLALFIVLILLALVIFVYKRMNKFSVKEVFLIHKGGVLITHVVRDPQLDFDDMIFSGMFTAVLDFINDSFSRGYANGTEESPMKDSVLDELTVGEDKILIERSENVFLAIIFTGSGSTRLRKRGNRLLDNIENEFGHILKDWNGDMTYLEATSELLRSLIKPLPEFESDSKDNISDPTPTTVYSEPLLWGGARHSSQIETEIQSTNLPQDLPVNSKLDENKKKSLPIKKPKQPSKQMVEPLVGSTTKPTTLIARPAAKLIAKPAAKLVAKPLGIQPTMARPLFVAFPLSMNRRHHYGLPQTRATPNIPMALNIRPHRVQIKPEIIRKIKIKSRALKNSHTLTMDNKSEVPKTNSIYDGGTIIPNKITINRDGKEFQLDLNRSILQQLTKFNE
ncbi:hypothetical protein [[Eubacterium] cellulosolvens]